MQAGLRDVVKHMYRRHFHDGFELVSVEAKGQHGNAQLVYEAYILQHVDALRYLTKNGHERPLKYTHGRRGGDD